MDKAGNQDARLDWIEPAVVTLQVSETAATPQRGGDRNSYIDCSRS